MHAPLRLPPPPPLQSLWHYVHQVDAQLQQLRATQQYLYWRERRHRMTVESTNRWGGRGLAGGAGGSQVVVV